MSGGGRGGSRTAAMASFRRSGRWRWFGLGRGERRGAHRLKRLAGEAQRGRTQTSHGQRFGEEASKAQGRREGRDRGVEDGAGRAVKRASPPRPAPPKVAVLKSHPAQAG
ncbi:hypothetical protein PIB30_007033 [Stylosanthes scabra]|uniref:Uncharacterized protein n=1 Tax=Stylosanthes scabra TaxID=79078 RepID=A0ABU6Q4J3_9FABA|nr:hypothetical protein [Stylosanthes scabra]